MVVSIEAEIQAGPQLDTGIAHHLQHKHMEIFLCGALWGTNFQKYINDVTFCRTTHEYGFVLLTKRRCCHPL